MADRYAVLGSPGGSRWIVRWTDPPPLQLLRLLQLVDIGVIKPPWWSEPLQPL